MRKRSVLKSLALVSLCFGPLVSTSFAADIKYPKTVIELFTSQGCYSCPPADKIIGKLSKEDDILALSWHVDYWDYLGWKDTFASKANTQRQYGYARTLQERQVYTPQAVINGRSHAVGSREAEIRKVAKYFSNDEKGIFVPLNADLKNDTLTISVPSDAADQDATLYLVYFNKKHRVKIDNGENGGKELDYHNVVGDMQALGMVKSDGLKMQYPISEVKRAGFDSCAIILQEMDASGNPGPIIGAVELTDL